MKRSLLLALPLLAAQLAFAQSSVPGAISYQGRVADANGVLIGDTGPVNRKVTLRIYDAATATTPIYAEEQTVTINKGVFSVLVGQGLQVGSEPRPAIATVFNGSERFLGVTVDDGGAAPDPEITPRQQIVSTAFAFTAKNAEVAGSVQQASGTSNINWLTVNNFTSNGHTKITGNNVLELGTGVTKGEGNGMIAYQALSTGLDITGAGTAADFSDRRITMHAQGGTDFLGSINFGTRIGQHINLYGTTFGTGIQGGTLYNRTADHFAWYRGGSHHPDALNAGGGQTLAILNGSGLSVNTGGIHVNGGALNVNNGGGLNVNNGGMRVGSGFLDISSGLRFIGGGANSPSLEFGAGVAKEVNNGRIGYQLFGANNALDIVGAGPDVGSRRVSIYAQGGSTFYGPVNMEQNLSVGGSINGSVIVGTSAGSNFQRDITLMGSEGDIRFPYSWAIHTHGGGLEFWYQNGMKSFINGAGDYVKTSDRNLKRDIKPLGAALEKVLKLKPATYHYKAEPKNTQTSYGFIAQEVQEVLPDLVIKHDKGTLGLSYEGFIPVAIGAIQDQQKLIQAKDAEIAALKKELAAAKEANTAQDTRLAAIEKALKLESASSAPAKKETKVASRR